MVLLKFHKLSIVLKMCIRHSSTCQLIIVHQFSYFSQIISQKKKKKMYFLIYRVDERKLQDKVYFPKKVFASLRI